MRMQLGLHVKIMFFFAAVFQASAPVKADNHLQQDIFLATRIDLPPYVENAARTGIEIDLINAIFSGSPYRPIFMQQPRVRMISSFEGDQMNGILTQNIRSTNAGCATDVYISHENVAKTIASRNIEITGLASLAGKSVLSFDGATRYIGKVFGDAVAKADRYIETSNQRQHIELLYMRRFDIVVGDRWILQLAQKKHYDTTGEYEVLATHSILKPSDYVARFHDQAVCDFFNKKLTQMRQNGGYDAVWAKYEEMLQFSEVVSPGDMP